MEVRPFNMCVVLRESMNISCLPQIMSEEFVHSLGKENVSMLKRFLGLRDFSVAVQSEPSRGKPLICNASTSREPVVENSWCACGVYDACFMHPRELA